MPKVGYVCSSEPASHVIFGYNLLTNGIYWDYNPFTNHLILTSWDIPQYRMVSNSCLKRAGLARWFACCTLHRAEGWYVGMPVVGTLDTGANWQGLEGQWSGVVFSWCWGDSTQKWAKSICYVPLSFWHLEQLLVVEVATCWLVITRIIISSQSLRWKLKMASKGIGDSFWKPSFLGSMFNWAMKKGPKRLFRIY